MSHVMDMPQVQSQIEAFKASMRENFICFDPGDVDEFALHTTARAALEDGRAAFEMPAESGPVMLRTADVLQISGDIMGQIYARDFKMVDQSDLIISYIPELPGGKPGVSSGVERELHHAYEGGKEVYVIWACRATPSPFITETATRVFRDTGEAMEHFQARGYIR
jgi:adenylate kinase